MTTDTAAAVRGSGGRPVRSHHTSRSHTMTAYRHRTTEVEAVQWTGHNADVLRAFAGANFDEIELDDRVDDPDETAAVREADHGTWRGLKPGDWVVKLEGGLYEFSAADFASQYEAVSSAVAQSAPAETALRDRIRRAVCEAEGFAWDSDMLEPDEYGDHADMILAVLPAAADLAELTKQTDLRDYWHAEAMSATTRIIELEGQLEELRPRLADGPPAAASAVSSVGQAAHTTRGAEEHLARVHEWVTSDVVTARNEFGNGYREAQRDIRDLLAGRRMADETQPAEGETESGCAHCGHSQDRHMGDEHERGCHVCWDLPGNSGWNHQFHDRDTAGPAVGAQQPKEADRG